MYNLKAKDIGEIRDEIPLYIKIHDIMTFHADGYKIVVFIKENKFQSDQRYRVDNMLEVLQLSDKWCGVSLLKSEVQYLENYFMYIDLIILSRLQWNENLEALVHKFHEFGKRVIYGVDDMVFHPVFIDEIIAAINDNNYEVWSPYWRKYTCDLNKIAQLCDGYLATNDFLKKKLEEVYQKDSYTFKNFINKKQLLVSEDYMSQKMNYDNYEDKFVLGYFSGSNTHYKDFCIVQEEISEFLKRHDNTYLKVVGYMDIPEQMKDLQISGRVYCKPAMDYCTLQKEMAEVDVNIVPLAESDFTDCKSELKYFEAGIVGTISCMTPAYVYKMAVEDGVNGYLCQKGDWLKTFELLYCRRYPSLEKMKMIKDCVYEQYAYNNLVDKLEGLLDKMQG